jgi:hypothetical protein
MKTAISKNGVTIRLISERWSHITTGHPEITDYYYEILETVESQKIVYEGDFDCLIAVSSYLIIEDRFIVVVYKEISKIDRFIIPNYAIKKYILELYVVIENINNRWLSVQTL